MTTVATAEDLTLAPTPEIRGALAAITCFRNRPTTSRLLRNRIDLIQAELLEELDARELRTHDNAEEAPCP
jgi:hypothetical protein